MRSAITSLLMLSGLSLMMSGCTSAPVTEAAPPKVGGSGTCAADKVQWAIGQEGVQATMGRVWRESGAGLIRPISPNQAVTRDYRPDRVNVELDAKNVITRITCG
jgi:hypothetical protein